MFCRERGFAHEEELRRREVPDAQIVVEDVREVQVDEPGVPEGRDEAKVPAEAVFSEIIPEPSILPFGPELDESFEVARKESMSRKGCMKTTPAKISRSLRRIEEIAESTPSKSKRSIVRQTAEEFATSPQNCYRWIYEWGAAKQQEVHQKAESHLMGVLLPSQLKAMSLGRIRRADVCEKITSEFVKRREASKKVDFN